MCFQTTFESCNKSSKDSSCQDPNHPDEGAKPGIRLRAFVSYFNDSTNMSWAYTSICDSDFTSVFTGTGGRIRQTIEDRSFSLPIKGCTSGNPLGNECSSCVPECVAFDVEFKGFEPQAIRKIPWCGHVCINGLCTLEDLKPCRYDANGKCLCTAFHYPTALNGQEGCAPLYFSRGQQLADQYPGLADILPKVDPTCFGPHCGEETAGRASACWYLTPNDEVTSKAELHVARTQNPPPHTFAEGYCTLFPTTELFCNDGKDDDGDCLVDMEDPDCKE